MGKSEEMVRKDVAALIKLVLSELEVVASLPPELASSPYEFDERRKRIVRRIWSVYKEALACERTECQP